MKCPHCSHTTDPKLLLCSNSSCSQPIFATASLDELRSGFLTEKYSGAFLEVIRRAYQSDIQYERERSWEFAYSPVRDLILQIFQYHRASRSIVHKLESSGYSRDDLVNEVFLRQLITNEARQFNNLKALRAFLERRTSFALISIFRSHVNLPPTVLERYFRLQVLSNRNVNCIEELFSVLNSEDNYAANLKKRGIKPAARQRKLRLRQLNLFLLRKSIYQLKKTRQIFAELETPIRQLFETEYSLAGKSDKTQSKKLSDLKGDAMIELWSILLSGSNDSSECLDYKQYSLSILTPYIESLNENLHH